MNATWYKLHWGPVLQHLANGIIIRYEVKSKLVREGKRDIKNNQRVFNVASKEYDLYGLKLCAQYNVSIRAYTSKGPGPYSVPTAIITQSK